MSADGGFYHHDTCSYGWPAEDGGVNNNCDCGTMEKLKKIESEREAMKEEIKSMIEELKMAREEFKELEYELRDAQARGDEF